MGSIDGWVDPEVKAMQDMIYGAVDASFEDRNRAKEGAYLDLVSACCLVGAIAARTLNCHHLT
jgi:hypothetical protein